MAGVTVRALHHYDRIGLLKPKRTSAGYRVYSTQDLESLEHIVALKFIGIPLRKIAVLRHGSPATLAVGLRAQRQTLEGKRQLLDQAINAIRELEAMLTAGRIAEPVMFKRIIEVIEIEADRQASGLSRTWSPSEFTRVEPPNSEVRRQAGMGFHDPSTCRQTLSPVRSTLRAEPRAIRCERPDGCKRLLGGQSERKIGA